MVSVSGMRPTIRHHYRGTKMALWLDLIPKLHESEDLDPTYHLLTNYDNSSTFEEEGTDELDLERLFPPPPLPPLSPPPSSTEVATTTTTPLPTTLPPSTTSTVSTTSSYERWGSESRSPPKYTDPPPEKTTPKAEEVSSVKDTTLSLSVTIAVGCSLLFLNILIFAGVYYQKDRMRMEMKMRQREMEKERTGAPDSNDNPKSSSGGVPETDTNSSSMQTPPVPPCISRHQVQPQATTLPKQPIPVLPPQAPYHARATSARDLHMGHSDSPRHHMLPRNATQTLPLNRDSSMKLRHSPSVDGSTAPNSHPSNPVTMV